MAEGKHREAENRRIGITEAESGMACLARRERAPDLYRGKVLQFRGKSIHFPRKDGRGMQAEWP